MLEKLRSLGLPFDEFIPDGTIHRTSLDRKDGGKKSAWYIGFQNQKKSGKGAFTFVQCGNWRTREEWELSSEEKLSEEDRKAALKQIKEAQAKRVADTEKKHAEGALAAQNAISSLKTEGISKYLERKGLTSDDAPGIYYSESGVIYIPRKCVEGNIWSYQTIDKEGKKKFQKGARIKGTYFEFGQPSDTVHICEGFATGASIYKSLGKWTVVAFDAHSLVNISQILMRKFPDIKIIICADNDDAGINAAEEAKSKTGASIVFPNSENDFNDLMLTHGEEAVKNDIEGVKEVKLELFPLGVVGDEFVVTSTYNPQIHKIKSFTFDKFDLVMPRFWWEKVFPGKKPGQFDRLFAASYIREECLKKGLFVGENDKFRSSGVWLDRGRVVVHCGNNIVVDGEEKNLYSLKDSDYYYLLSKKYPNPTIKKPLSVEECKPLINACLNFKWKSSDSGIFLLGLLVCAKICGSLPVRPHAWLTGSAQTGKSTLFRRLIKPILGRYAIEVMGSTTEAGLRGIVGYGARPVIFDEFESDVGAAEERVKSLIELMRATWGESGGQIVKGSPDGSVQNYRPIFSAIVSSIQTKLLNEADRGRFTVLELVPHGSDITHWRSLSTQLLKIDREFSERFFSRSIKMVPNIIENYKRIRDCLQVMVNARYGDQMGMILGAYYSLISDDVIPFDVAESMAEVYSSDPEEVTNESDHEDCLNHLMTTIYEVESSVNYNRTKLPIGEIINRLVDHDKSSLGIDLNRALMQMGLKIISCRDETFQRLAFIQNYNSEIYSKVFRGTKWGKNYIDTLKRVSSSKRVVIRQDKKTFRSLTIPIR